MPVIFENIFVNFIFYEQGYFDKYDPTINPSAAQGFTTAAYRFGHSLLPSTVGEYSFSQRYFCSFEGKHSLNNPRLPSIDLQGFPFIW